MELEIIAAITGHRYKCLNNEQQIFATQSFHEAVKNLYKIYDVKSYMVGMALGSDLFAAEELLYLKKEGSIDIKIIPVLPCNPVQQYKYWDSKNIEKYTTLIEQLECPIIYSQQYTKSSALRRNDIMESYCHVLIAFYDGRTTGGTFYTVKNAIQHNKTVYTIDPFNMQTKWMNVSPIFKK